MAAHGQISRRLDADVLKRLPYDLLKRLDRKLARPRRRALRERGKAAAYSSCTKVMLRREEEDSVFLERESEDAMRQRTASPANIAQTAGLGDVAAKDDGGALLKVEVDGRGSIRRG